MNQVTLPKQTFYDIKLFFLVSNQLMSKTSSVHFEKYICVAYYAGGQMFKFDY